MAQFALQHEFSTSVAGIASASASLVLEIGLAATPTGETIVDRARFERTNKDKVFDGSATGEGLAPRTVTFFTDPEAVINGDTDAAP